MHYVPMLSPLRLGSLRVFYWIPRKVCIPSLVLDVSNIMGFPLQNMIVVLDCEVGPYKNQHFTDPLP